MIWVLALLRFLFLDTDPGGSDADDTDDDGAGSGGGASSGDGDSDDDEKEIRDPKGKLASLQSANARLAKKAKKFQARVEELERGNSNGGAALRAAQLEAAFLRAMRDHAVSDLDDAWDLCQAKGFLDVVKIDESGQVEGMDAAIEKLLARYPWLIEDDTDAETPERPSPVGPKIRPPIRDKEARPLPNRKTLEKRMPALRRGHR